MQSKRLGRTDLELTRVGFGAWAIGGADWTFGWGAQDDEESVAAIHRAVELGLNWVDTAAVYGFGHSEEVVARAVRELDAERRPYVFTKCEQNWHGDGRTIQGVLKRDEIRREVQDSLRRLGVEQIDLMQIHWPNPDEGIEEGWEALCELREGGVLRHIGVSNFDVGQMQRAARIGRIDSLQPPYSLIRRGIEDEILPYCLEEGIGVIAYSPMASGLLTGKYTRERIDALPDDDWRSRSHDFQEPKLSRNLEVVEAVRRVAERQGVSPGAVAIAWTLRHPAVTAAIVGFRRPSQVDDLVGAADLALSDDDARELEEVSAAAAVA